MVLELKRSGRRISQKQCAAKAMETQIKVSHQQVPLKSSYEAFRTNLEKIVNKLDPEYARDVLKAPETLKEYLAGLGA